MPIVEIKMTEGRTDEQKAQLIAEVTEVVSRIAVCPKNVVSVIVDDKYSLRDWGVGGETWQKKLEH